MACHRDWLDAPAVANRRSFNRARLRGRGGRVANPVVVAALLATTACGTGAPVAQDPLLEAIAAGDPPPILDVRTTKEYLEGHVPGAIHIPYHEIWFRRGDLPPVETESVVVYCSHGPRAGIAAFQLWTLGYDNVVFLDGQMSGWKRRGLPLKAGDEP